MNPQTEQHLANTLRARNRGEQIADEIGRALLGDAWHGPALTELLAYHGGQIELLEKASHARPNRAAT